jgi:hypothetical protein
MVPYDSFLIDPPWLFGMGVLIGRYLPGRRVRQAVAGGTVAAFVVTSVSLYFNLGWTDWIVRLCRAESGRDWMLNSGVFKFEYEKPGPFTHAIAAIIFLTYPLWCALGVRLGVRLAARGE